MASAHPPQLSVADALNKLVSAVKNNDSPLNNNNISHIFETPPRKVSIESDDETTTPNSEISDPASVVAMPADLARILENLTKMPQMAAASNSKNFGTVDAIPQPLATIMPESLSKILSNLPKQEVVTPTKHTESPPAAEVPESLAKILADLRPQHEAGPVESAKIQRTPPPITNVSDGRPTPTPSPDAILNFLKDHPQPYMTPTPSPPRGGGGNIIPIIPSGGDLLVITQNQQLLVSSAVLSLASPVLAGMVTASRSQAGMDMTCGDPKAIYILVALLHHRLDLVPPSITSGQLKSIAEVVGRYQLLQSLGQWPEHWMSMWNENSTEWKDWLVVAYVFQNSAMFRWATRMAVLCSTTDTSAGQAGQKDAEGRVLVTDKEGATRLFVGGIPLDCSTEFLQNIFKSRGFRVWSVDKKKGKGYGFISIGDGRAAEAAQTLRNTYVAGCNRPLDIGPANHREKENNGPVKANRPGHADAVFELPKSIIDKISRDRMKALGAAMHSVQKLRAWCHDNVFAGKLCINPSSQEQDETEMCELTIFGFIGVRLARAGLKSRWGPPFEGHSVDILLSTLDMPVMALTGCHDQCKAQADRAVSDFFNEVQDIANGVVGFDLLPESAGAPPESWSSTQRTSNGAGYAAGTKRAGAALFPDSFKRVAM